MTYFGWRAKRGMGVVLALGLAAVVVANYALFRVFEVNYFRWYLEAGPWIALIVSGVAVAVDLERVPDLIAVHPASFLAACFEVIGESVTSMELSDRHNPGSTPKVAGPLDSVFALLYGLAYFTLLLAWLVVIAPLQYFGNLVTGAPARTAISSPWRQWVQREPATVQGPAVITLSRTPIGRQPAGAEEIGLARRPVALTSSITAALLFVIGQFV